ncbi:hypothetical protein UFOVP112_197 [uncultured Caudovirales phage]|uniref:Uncharacterized protein n=1 Tax=uncultured Caudovirales phage TaxID=2100421 RepID=A0A6J5LBF2_9CAUD|nr:hypothetical protein UFOVP112_197 [uncultured Caudovirales phage]
MKDNFLESDFLSAKRIAVFLINRPQSEPTVDHIKSIHCLHPEFIKNGIDDVWCISIGDFLLFDLLMPKLSNRIKFDQNNCDSNIESIKTLLNKKGNKNFLKEYWQFACILNNGCVEQYIEQPFIKKIPADTRQKIYSNVGPDSLLTLLTTKEV